MMTPPALAASLLALSACLSAPALALEYSAETLQSAPGMPPILGKIYVGKTAVRTEQQMGGRTFIEIISRDTGTIRRIMPEAGAYMEKTVDPAMLPPSGPPESPCQASPQVACSKVGKVELNGLDAERWDITPAGAPQPIRVWWDAERKMPLRQELLDGRVMQATLRGPETYEGESVESWEFVFMAPDGIFDRTMALYSKKLAMPVLTQSAAGFTYQLRGIKTEAPDVKLFALPDGLRKIEPAVMPMPPLDAGGPQQPRGSHMGGPHHPRSPHMGGPQQPRGSHMGGPMMPPVGGPGPAAAHQAAPAAPVAPAHPEVKQQ